MSSLTLLVPGSFTVLVLVKKIDFFSFSTSTPIFKVLSASQKSPTIHLCDDFLATLVFLFDLTMKTTTMMKLAELAIMRRRTGM